jgi:AraC family transcriptional regulator
LPNPCLHWRTAPRRRYHSVPPDSDAKWCADIRSEWARFHLHPPIDFDLKIQEPHYLVLTPFAPATFNLATGGGPFVRTRLRAGSVTFVEPNRCLRLVYVEPVEFMLLCIDPERVRALGEALAPGRPWHARTVTDLRDAGIAALSKEIRRATVADHPAHPPYLQSLADAMMVRLLCHFLGEVDTTVGREALSPGMLARIVQHIDAHLSEPMSVEELASLAKLTRSHFSRAFHRMTGAPPQRFIIKRRICRARDLLTVGNESIADIASSTGFSSQAHLSTVFLREVGTTPARYRAGFKPDGPF